MRRILLKAYTKSSLKEKSYVITKFDVKKKLNQTKIKIKHKYSNRLHFCMNITSIYGIRYKATLFFSVDV